MQPLPLRALSFLAALLVCAAAVSPASAQISLEAGDWTVSFSGNVNAHYVYSGCDDDPGAVDGAALLCAGDDKSSVQNGLLPAGLVTSASTTQNGLDISATFGLYIGTVSNQALDNTPIDARQVYLTFGNDEMGTFLVGRNYGLFGLDAILSDMSLIGVGPNASAASPISTSLAGIGYGYLYADRLSQINYTFPGTGNFEATVGIFQPLDFGSLGTTNVFTGDSGSQAPGAQGRVRYNFGGEGQSASGFISASGLVEGISRDALDDNFTAYGLDATASINFGAIGLSGTGYIGEGIGITALFFDAADASGEARTSGGGFGQVTFTAGTTTLGLHYGISTLGQTGSEEGPGANTNLSRQQRFTAGVYPSLTPNLTLVLEGSYYSAESHAEGDITNFGGNLGAFLAF